jgi:sirohydrochlorin ferrochelatase
MKTGIIIVDHGSRRQESNQMLVELARCFGARFAAAFDIVEPAHMEMAEPTIATAYAKCAAQGATMIVVCPYFLGPGKHWTEDIPRLAAEAARQFPQTRFHVTPTLGIDDLILDLLMKRIGHCQQFGYDCVACRGSLPAGQCPVARDSGGSTAAP